MYAVGLKTRFGYDDSLDVVGVHLVGGVIGTLLIGFFASEGMPNGVNGLLYGGGIDQLWKQAVAAGAVMLYSFAVAYLIAFALKKTVGIRVSPTRRSRVSTPSSTANPHTTGNPSSQTLRPARGVQPRAGRIRISIEFPSVIH